MCKALTKNDVNSVKVSNSEYYLHTYRGKINGAKNYLITLCCPKEVLFKDICVRSFITLDTTLSTEELLDYYKHRWPMEIMF